MSRRLQEIVQELHQETHAEGYYCNKPGLERIVDELMSELAYIKVLDQLPPIKPDRRMFRYNCNLPMSDEDNKETIQ